MPPKDNNPDLKRVGYDITGETPRSASFMLEDDTEKEIFTREPKLTMGSIRQARAEQAWVRELEWSLVDPDTD
ncbi:MAG: hypothetical protein U9Q23_02595, partial [Candidatus Bipolaricaulota bacterium]|nr:hypothetical protein [Candidatus Bipolaricaulota bacterium]